MSTNKKLSDAAQAVQMALSEEDSDAYGVPADVHRPDASQREQAFNHHLMEAYKASESGDSQKAHQHIKELVKHRLRASMEL